MPKKRVTKQQVKEMENRIQDIKSCGELMRFMKAMHQFHTYSHQNQMLILFQCPHATYVASFRRWLALKRYVRKGEKGIMIFVPMSIKDPLDENAEPTIRFKAGYVFDVSQTEGDDLPEAPKDFDVETLYDTVFVIASKELSPIEAKVCTVTVCANYGIDISFPGEWMPEDNLEFVGRISKVARSIMKSLEGVKE